MNVELTCELDKASNTSALSIESKRECIIPRSQRQAFQDDCNGWNQSQFNRGYSIVVTISETDWAKWLAAYEID